MKNLKTFESYTNSVVDPELVDILQQVIELVEEEENGDSIHISEDLGVKKLSRLIKLSEDSNQFKIEKILKQVLDLVKQEINGDTVHISEYFSPEQLKKLMNGETNTFDKDSDDSPITPEKIANMSDEELKKLTMRDLDDNDNWEAFVKRRTSPITPEEILKMNISDIKKLKVQPLSNAAMKALGQRTEELGIYGAFWNGNKY